MSVSHVRNQFHTFLHINVNTQYYVEEPQLVRFDFLKKFHALNYTFKVLSRSGVDNDKEVPLKNTHKTEKHI
jgi:hypothetical protein